MGLRPIKSLRLLVIAGVMLLAFSGCGSENASTDFSGGINSVAEAEELVRVLTTDKDLNDAEVQFGAVPLGLWNSLLGKPNGMHIIDGAKRSWEYVYPDGTVGWKVMVNSSDPRTTAPLTAIYLQEPGEHFTSAPSKKVDANRIKALALNALEAFKKATNEERIARGE